MAESVSPMGFGALYERHARDVYRFALALTGNVAQAEDLTAEAFLRVWQAGERVELNSVKAYLFAIVRNLYLKELAKRSRMTDVVDRPQCASTAGAELEEVLRMLQELPEDSRAALMLRAEQDMSYAEIGAVLGMSEGAAWVFGGWLAGLALGETLCSAFGWPSNRSMLFGAAMSGLLLWVGEKLGELAEPAPVRTVNTLFGYDSPDEDQGNG